MTTIKSVMALFVMLLSLSLAFAGQLPGAREKARVRSIIAEVESISKDCGTLEEFGKRTISQGKEILSIGPAAVYPLSGCLNSGDWKVRFWIADMLGYLENNDAKRPLLRVLNDRSENARVRAQADISLKRLAMPLEKEIQ